MNSKLLTVTVALNQLLIENLDRMENYSMYRQKLKKTGKIFNEHLMAESKRFFATLPPEQQLVFFKEVKVLETIIREYQNGNLKVIEESELKIESYAA